MRLKKILVTALILSISLTSLVGCGKDKQDTKDLRTEYFTSLQNSINTTQGESEINVLYEYTKEDENANPMASSLVENKGKEKLGIVIKSLVDSSKNTNSELYFSSSEMGIENLKFLNLTFNNKAIYINTTDLFSGLLTLVAKSGQLDGFNENISQEEITSTLNSVLDEYKKQVGTANYLMINFEELITLVTDKADEEISIQNKESLTKCYDELIVSIIDISTKTTEIEKAIMFETFKQVESSYETTLVQYDKENNYYYITLNETQFIDFYTRTQEFLTNNLENMVDSFSEQLKLQNSLTKMNNTLQNLANEIQKMGVEINQEEVTATQNQFTLEYIKETIIESIDTMKELDTETIKKTPLNIIIATFNLGNGYRNIIKFESQDQKLNLTTTQISSDKQVTIPTQSSFSIVDLLNNFLTNNENLIGSLAGNFNTPEEETEFNEESNENFENPYLYNQVVVIANENVQIETIKELAKDYNASLDTYMSDVNIYLFIFNEEYSEEELKELVAELNDIEYIEQAHINYPIEMDPEGFIE